MAEIVRQATGDPDPIGKNWIYSFLGRNPLVKPMIGRRIVASRINSASKEEIRRYFQLLKDVVAKYAIKSVNTYNMDEHGTNLGAANNTKVIGEAARSIGGSTHRKMPENREWVSVLETIGLGKHRIPPVVIFKGKYSQTTWFPLDIASLDLSGWRFACSENGWT
ncbi:hypothetical protein K402DRAFT_142319, partial [Aulographum hederae CBS 113979]